MVSFLAVQILAQQPDPASEPPPQVKVNMLNVRTPSGEEQREIVATLAKIAKQPLFAAGFEVARPLHPERNAGHAGSGAGLHRISKRAI